MAVETGRSTGLRMRTPQGRWVLLATVLGSGIAAIDATVVGIALPTIGREFSAPLSALQWVFTAYALTLAGLLLVGGALGDRYGRRRIFIAGTVWFAVASLLCAIAPSAEFLIVARALQGVGGALLTPGSLAILQASFAPDHRARAIGAWSGLGGVATAIGPFIGGWLVDVASWRLIFLINLPLAVAVVLVAVRFVPETRDEEATGSVDALGGFLVTLGLMGVTYGLIEGPDSGWTSGPVATALGIGVLSLVVFAWWEGRASSPLLPAVAFASRQFAAANVVTFVVYGALGGALFLIPIQLQQVAGYSALESGLALIPVTLIMLALSSRSGALATQIGPRLQMSVGPMVVGAGLAMLTMVGQDASYVVDVLPAIVVFGLGLAITVAPLTATVLAAAPANVAGMASAINNAVARAAGLVAVAVLPAAAGIGGSVYLDPPAFSAGFHRAVLICALLCLLGGMLSALTIRNPSAEPIAVRDGRVNCPLDAPPLRGDPAGRRASAG